jgi:preprotein translocase subunit SecG
MRSFFLIKIMKSLIKIFFAILIIVAFSNCKAKRCANFDNADKEYKLKYDRHGRVKR